ncbi:MAG TPA: hypothetical protein DCO72_04595 [Ruminococcus sp.]|nr:hypothetical protein [Ruminococcus sp.]
MADCSFLFSLYLHYSTKFERNQYHYSIFVQFLLRIFEISIQTYSCPKHDCYFFIHKNIIKTLLFE